MTSNKRFSLLPVAAIALCMAALTARAQVTTAPVIKAKPVHTEQEKPAKTRFEILHIITTALQARRLVNRIESHTFIYSDQIRDAMQKLLDQGGYQYGDQV